MDPGTPWQRIFSGSRLLYLCYGSFTILKLKKVYPSIRRCIGTSRKSIYKPGPKSPNSIKVVPHTDPPHYSHHQKSKSEHEKPEGYERKDNLAINKTDTKNKRTGLFYRSM